MGRPGRPKKLESSDPRSSRKARGLRLESIRKSLHLSRPELAERLNVSAYAIQNWERDKNNGLSEQKATVVINVLKQMGMRCTLEWLMYGIGTAPILADPILGDIILGESLDVPADQKQEKTELILIAEELKLFREHYSQRAIDIVVNDDGMEPHYKIGDYVAGLRRTGNNIARVIGYDCVLQTEEGDILLRHVKKGSLEGYYTLVCTNPSTTVIKPFLYDVKIIMAAPVIWIRRKDF